MGGASRNQSSWGPDCATQRGALFMKFEEDRRGRRYPFLNRRILGVVPGDDPIQSNMSCNPHF